MTSELDMTAILRAAQVDTLTDCIELLEKLMEGSVDDPEFAISTMVSRLENMKRSL